MAQESAPQPEGEKDKEKKDKRRWLQFSLGGLFLMVTGSAAVMKWWREKKIKEAAKELKAGWKITKEREQTFFEELKNGQLPLEIIDTDTFTIQLNDLRENIRNQNLNRGTFDPAIGLDDVAPLGERTNLASQHAHYQLEQLKTNFVSRGDLTAERRFRFNPDDEPYQLRRQVDSLISMQALSEASGISPSKLLGPDQPKVQDQVLSQVKTLWEQVKEFSDDPRPERAGYTKDKIGHWHTWWEDAGTEVPYGAQHSFQVPALIMYIDDLLRKANQLGGVKIKLSDAGIKQTDVARVAEAEISALWQALTAPKSQRDAQSFDPIILYQIRRLAEFAGKKPSDFIDPKEWQKVVRERAHAMFDHAWQDYANKDLGFHMTMHNLYFWLEQAGLEGTSPEIGFDPEKWKELQEASPRRVPAKRAQRLKTGQVETKPAEAIAATHSSWIRSTLEQMRQNAFSLDTAVMAAEVAAVTVSFFAASPIFAAVSSLAVTVKLAQLTGAAINKLRGKS